MCQLNGSVARNSLADIILLISSNVNVDGRNMKRQQRVLNESVPSRTNREMIIHFKAC